MKILFYDAATYDVESFEERTDHFPDIEIIYHEVDISPKTGSLAQGCDAICAFVNSDLSAPVLEKLAAINIKLVLLRCAGFNNIDLDKRQMNLALRCFVCRDILRKPLRSLRLHWRLR